MDTDNREIVILNARSIANRERSIGHPEVAAIIEDLASQLVVGERDAEMERLNARLVETQMLAFKWMDAHDKLHAGKPYEFPKPADLPEAIGERDRLQLAMDEALHWLALSNIDKADSILRAALNNTGGQSKQEGPSV